MKLALVLLGTFLISMAIAVMSGMLMRWLQKKTER